MKKSFIQHLGIIPYQPAHDLQKVLVDRLYRSEEKDVCLLLQHEPVFTLGRHASEKHIMVSRKILSKKNIDVVKTERGGEVTYHAPGQIICYPILNLRRFKLRVAEYVFALEQIMLDVVAGFGITAARDARNHGIWCGDKKMGSVGIAVRHGICYHGFALNVCPDLTPFAWINPCGLTKVSMTSMVEQQQSRISVKDVEDALACRLDRFFSSQEAACAHCE